MTLGKAINEQLYRAGRSNNGNLLCRVCKKEVPESFKFILHLPEDKSVVWGPCCSEDCICRLKICSRCKKDFPIEEITYQDNGIWLCNSCSKGD